MAAHERDEARRSIQRHRQVFEHLLLIADGALQKRQPKGALVYAQIAAHYAWLNHPGIFVSYELERVIGAAGRKAASGGAGPRRSSPNGGQPSRILHVMSEAHPTGGHTRLVWRWIQRDSERSHSVVLTNQRKQPLPIALAEAAQASGGRLHFLDGWTRDNFRRARALRELAEASDHVVLHIHPYDVLPVAAFGKGGLPPVTFLNHADHVFWVGVSVSHIVAHTRRSGLLLSQERRGIAGDRCALIPLPIISKPRVLSRTQAKELIGVSGATPVLLSIGSSYKYAPVHELNFAEILTSVIEENRRAVLLVVGVQNEGQWAEATRRTRGRIRPLGVQAELSTYYQAADIFVDSFPLCSETALLEAATYGVAPASYCPHPAAAEIMCTEASSIEPHLFRSHTLSEYKAFLRRLIEDAAFRSALGERIRQAVLDVHCGDAWRRFPQEVYLRAAGVASAAGLPGWTGSPDGTAIAELDILVDRLHALGGQARGFDENVQTHLRFLPPHLKIWLLRQMLAEGGQGKQLKEWLSKVRSMPYLDPERFEAVVRTLASKRGRRRDLRSRDRSPNDPNI